MLVKLPDEGFFHHIGPSGVRDARPVRASAKIGVCVCRL